MNHTCDNCGYLVSTIIKVDFGRGGIEDLDCTDPEPVDHDVLENGCEHWTPIVEEEVLQ